MRQLVDSQGLITKKNNATEKEIVEYLSKHSNEWHFPQNNIFLRILDGESSDGLATLNVKVNNMDRRKKKINQKVHTIQARCNSCSGLHLTKDCNMDKNKNKEAQMCYSSKENYDMDWRWVKNGWNP